HVPQEHPGRFGELVALYAVEKLHRVQIRLKDGKLAKLTAGILTDNGAEHLGVTADAPINVGDFELEIAFPIYMTKLNGRDWCEPELIPPHPLMGTKWDFAVEIGPSGKLQAL